MLANVDQVHVPVHQGSHLIQAVVDSGAYTHVCPVELATRYGVPLSQDVSGRGAQTATGQVLHPLAWCRVYAQPVARAVPVDAAAGASIPSFGLHFAVMKVRRVILSVTKLCKAGVVVHYGECSYLEVGGVRILLLQQAGLYVLPMRVVTVEPLSQEKRDECGALGPLESVPEEKDPHVDPGGADEESHEKEKEIPQPGVRVLPQPEQPTLE